MKYSGKDRKVSKNIAVIFAGGSGIRMGSGMPKQFLKINGQPIIIYTLEIFEDSPDIDEIYIACKEDYISKMKKYIRRYQLQKVKKIVPGGVTALDSIYNGLTAVAEENDPDSIVLIHDGVRPFIPDSIITRNIECVERYGSAITCTPMYETPVRSDGGELIEEVIPRDVMFTAQAPQSFRLGDIKKAYEDVRSQGSTADLVDSCSIYKKAGHDVALVRGNRGNIKVTTPEDLYLFRGLLNYKETQQTMGFTDREMEADYKK